MNARVHEYAFIHLMARLGTCHPLLTPDDPRQQKRQGPPRRYPFLECAQGAVGDYMILPDKKTAASCSTAAANFCRSREGVRFKVYKHPTPEHPERRICVRVS